ncbi:MAG: DUF2269 family protein [Ginsengibacter sp.]
MNHLFSIGLFIHIIGITCIAGGSIGGLILENHMWTHIQGSPEKASVLAPLMGKYPVVIQAGTLLMLLSGFLMLKALSWAVVGQWWFIIKMALVVALVLNGMLIAKPNASKLRVLVGQLVNGQPVEAELKTVRKKMIVFHFSEMSLLIVVYLLAVFQTLI